METSIVKKIMSDESIAYNVVAIDGSHKIVIGAIDERSARIIQEALADHAAHATVEFNGPGY